jgi:hypothetical protein
MSKDFNQITRQGYGGLSWYASTVSVDQVAASSLWLY